MLESDCDLNFLSLSGTTAEKEFYVQFHFWTLDKYLKKLLTRDIFVTVSYWNSSCTLACHYYFVKFLSLYVQKWMEHQKYFPSFFSIHGFLNISLNMMFRIHKVDRNEELTYCWDDISISETVDLPVAAHFTLSCLYSFLWL